MLCFPEFLHDVYIVNVFPCNIVLINVNEYEYTEMWIGCTLPHFATLHMHAWIISKSGLLFVCSLKDADQSWDLYTQTNKSIGAKKPTGRGSHAALCLAVCCPRVLRQGRLHPFYSSQHNVQHCPYCSHDGSPVQLSR